MTSPPLSHAVVICIPFRLKRSSAFSRTHPPNRLAAEMDAPRVVTSYRYHNRSYPNMECYLFVDTAFEQVQWQTRNGVTPWHGSWIADGRQVTVRFDASTTADRPAILKSTTLFPCGAGNLIGQDYRGRVVELVPNLQWRLTPPSPNTVGDPFGSWELHAEWSSALGDWVYL